MIQECQRLIVKHPDDDRYYLSARMSDMKLFTPNPKIEELIQEYERSMTSCNSSPKPSSTPPEASPK